MSANSSAETLSLYQTLLSSLLNWKLTFSNLVALKGAVFVDRTYSVLQLGNRLAGMNVTFLSHDGVTGDLMKTSSIAKRCYQYDSIVRQTSKIYL